MCVVRVFWSGAVGGLCWREGESYEEVFVSHVSSKIRSIFINKVIGFQAKMIEHDGKYWFLKYQVKVDQFSIEKHWL